MRSTPTNRVANLVRVSFWRRADIIVTVLMTGIPVILLIVFGLRFVFAEGLLPEFLLLSSFCMLVLFGFRVLWRNRTSVRVGRNAEIPLWLADPSWGPFEREVYEKTCRRIRDGTTNLLDWDQGLVALARETANDVAGLMSNGKRNNLDVSIPEILGLLDQVTHEGREFLGRTVMFSLLHNVSVNNLLWVLRNRNVMVRMVEGGDYFLKLTGFVANPPVGAVRALESLIVGNNTKYLSDQFQIELQRGILSYVAAKAVDLYSGRYRRGALPEMGSIAVEPVKMLMVGQPGAGKSSLAAAIASSPAGGGRGEAAHSIPKSDRVTLGGIQCVLMEAPGFDGRPEERRLFRPVNDLVSWVARREVVDSDIVKSFLDCDLVIWAVRADQPDRRIDADYLTMFREAFGGQKLRLVPPLLVAVTHVDRPPIINSWPNGSALSPAQLLKVDAAVEVVARSFDGMSSVPVRPVRPYWNVDMLIRAVSSVMPDACLAQSNRLRSTNGRVSGGHSASKKRSWDADPGKPTIEVGSKVLEGARAGAVNSAGRIGRIAALLPKTGELKERLGIGRWRNGKS